jgi:hypothetical protein
MSTQVRTSKRTESLAAHEIVSRVEWLPCTTQRRREVNANMRTFAQHFLRIVSPIASGIALALLPKCPMCVAAYLMMATGISISVATAVSLRAFLVLVCVSSLVLLGRRYIRNLRVGA